MRSERLAVFYSLGLKPESVHGVVMRLGKRYNPNRQAHEKHYTVISDKCYGSEKTNKKKRAHDTNSVLSNKTCSVDTDTYAIALSSYI